MTDNMHDLSLTGLLNTQRAEYDAAINAMQAEIDRLMSELAKFREASKSVYLGLQVLKTMCGKRGLTGGVDATESAMRGLVNVMPELPSLSSLRGSAIIMETCT